MKRSKALVSILSLCLSLGILLTTLAVAVGILANFAEARDILL